MKVRNTQARVRQDAWYAFPGIHVRLEAKPSKAYREATSDSPMAKGLPTRDFLGILGLKR
jgi:hypothetical protein